MKVGFDSSVLVAGAAEFHEHFDCAMRWLHAARDGELEAYATTHAFAETWWKLTALPIEPRMPTGDVKKILDRMSQWVHREDLVWNDYEAAMLRCSERNVRSGAIYDALHLVAAERLGASILLTFNTKHFTRLVGPNSPRILAPPDPPGLDLPPSA